MGQRGARARFLFRSEDGIVDAATWRLHAGWLVVLVAAMTITWLLLRPYTHHDLATSPFFAPMTILAFAYLIVYAFAVIIVAISYTMLTAKRLRDRGEPTALAALVPMVALLVGAVHFIQPQAPDVIAHGYLVAADLGAALVVLGTVADLGFRPSRR